MKILLLSLILAAPVHAAEPAKAPAKPAAAPAAEAPAKDPYKTDDQRSFYTIGFLMGRNVASFNLTPAEVKIVQAGLSDAALQKGPLVDVRFHQSRINDLLTKRMGAAAEGEKKKGQAYVDKWLKENKDKAKAIPGGGWMIEEKEGTGPVATKTDTVKAHYRGTTVDGVQFDSSYDRGEPTEFFLGRVIPCWTNAFSMMKAGGRVKLVCPSDVAYGDPGRPGIKPGATLLFDAELVEIVKPAEPAKDAKKK